MEQQNKAEQEVRSKLGWVIASNYKVKHHIDGSRSTTGANRDEVQAYNLCISQAQEIASLKEQLAMLEGELPGKLKGERALNEEFARCFLERATAAEARAESLFTELERVKKYARHLPDCKYQPEKFGSWSGKPQKTHPCTCGFKR